MWAFEVVAPPINRVIDPLAILSRDISSRLGVMRPKVRSCHLVFLAASRIARRLHDPQIHDLEAIALQDDADDVLADVVIALDQQQYPAFRRASVFSASIKQQWATARFMTRADFTTWGKNI